MNEGIGLNQDRSGDLQVATSGRGRWQRKSVRLNALAYRGPQAYSLTITTAGRERWFIDEATVASCRHALYAACDMEHFLLLAYVFMPDHLHLLIQGTDQHSRLPGFMKRFKQSTAHAFKSSRGVALWQKGYFDHVLRSDEDLGKVVDYLLENPVRAGLVSDWAQFPHLGGDLVVATRDGDLKVAATSEPPNLPASLTLPRPSLA